MSSRSFRNNNPGNIRHHSPSGAVYPIVKRWFAEDDGSNYAKFNSVPEGCAALADLIALAYQHVSVRDMINKYAPSDDNNDPDKYLKTICGWAGVLPMTQIRDLPPDKFFDLCRAITRFEGWIP
jgi:hypothetical protein